MACRRSRSAGGSPWSPIKEDPQLALSLLGDIVRRNQPVMTALAALQQRGHTLTLLLGNHDVELAFPAVRALGGALPAIRPCAHNR